MAFDIQRGIQSVAQGFRNTMRGGSGADGVVSEFHGRYYQTTKDGNEFSASIQAVATTSVGLSTTYTGLVISNPITSAIDMVVNKVSIMQSVIQATQVEAFAIAVGFNAATNVTHSAALTTRSNLIGSGFTSVGLADTSATLPTAPFYHTFVTNTGTAIADSTGAMVVDLEGSIILPPGGYAMWVTPAQASVAGMWFSFSWEEFAR
jgi:hypothetical protein